MNRFQFVEDHKDVKRSCEVVEITRSSFYAWIAAAPQRPRRELQSSTQREPLKGRPAFPDEAATYRAVFQWANRYNARRRHSVIGNITPNAYETAAASTTVMEAA